jgi:glutaredoxin
MRTRTIAVLLALLAAHAAYGAQLYRWVDEHGRVEWRDTPPPPTAKEVEQRRVQGNLSPSTPLPYATQVATRNFPVTLWTAKCGEPCDKAKAQLARRGVPYAEKSAESDREGLRKATGGLEVPVLVVGHTQLKGYDPHTWDEALDAAGYPGSPNTSP